MWVQKSHTIHRVRWLCDSADDKRARKLRGFAERGKRVFCQELRSGGNAATAAVEERKGRFAHTARESLVGQ